MAKGSKTQNPIRDGNELGREKAGGELKQPWLPPLGRSEEDAEGVSKSKIREFIGCSHGAIADNHRGKCYDHPKNAVHQDAKWPGPWGVGHSMVPRSKRFIEQESKGRHNRSRDQVWHQSFVQPGPSLKSLDPGKHTEERGELWTRVGVNNPLIVELKAFGIVVRP